MKKWIIIIITLCFFTLLLPIRGFAKASFTVGPQRVIVNLKAQNKTLAFLVRNTGDQLIHLRTNLAFYKINSKFLKAGVPLHPKKESQYSLLPNTIISPQALSLQPGQQGEVRVSLRRGNLLPGTYHTHVVFRMLEFANIHSKLDAPDGKQVAKLNILLQISPIIYANVGEPKPAVAHLSLKKIKGQWYANVKNTSIWHLSGDVVVKSKGGKHVIKKLPLELFRDSTVQVALGLPTQLPLHFSVEVTPVKSKTVYAEAKV